MDILDQAIEFEYLGHKFYTERAEMVSSEALKNILLSLADDELQHADFLKRLKMRQVDEFKPTRSMFKIKKIIEESSMNNPTFLSDEADILAVLNQALEIEDKARRHYTSEQVNVFDDNTKELLRLLSLEEEKHYNLISNLIKYIEEPKNMLETQEFQHYDE